MPFKLVASQTDTRANRPSVSGPASLILSPYVPLSTVVSHLAIGMAWVFVGSIIQAASFEYAMLVVSRFLGGIGIGVLSSVAPMYISEIAPPNVRGAFLALEGATVVVGIVIVF